MSRYEDTAYHVTEALEHFDLGEAGRLLYEFIWNEYCDWYIELTKKRLYSKDNPEGKNTAQSILLEVLEGTMRLLHPFMPFLTEEIWQHLPTKGKTIMLSSWPGVSGYRNEQAEKEMALIMEVIRSVRNIRSEMNVAPGRRADIILVAPEEETMAVLQKGLDDIRQLALGEQISLLQKIEKNHGQAASAVLTGVSVYIPLKGLLDFDKEIAKIRKEIENALAEQKRLEGKLNNPGFVGKAPEEVIVKEKEKLEAVANRLHSLRIRLSDLSEANEKE